MAKKSTANISGSSIPQQDKERLKTLFSEFLSHKEYRELESGWLRESDMMLTLCAAYGKFDFSVVLEHFADLMAAVKFIGRPKEFMTWNEFVIHYAAYCLLDCPLLQLSVGCSNDFDFMKKELDSLLFASYLYYRKKAEDILKGTELPKSLEKAFKKDDLTCLFEIIDADPQSKKLIENVAYTALLKEKWNIFAELCTRYDLPQYVDMEKVFDFWCRILLPNSLHYSLGSNETFDFFGQWQEPEKYPLHRMMIEYGRELCVPALYCQGFLLPEVIEYLWGKGISFDSPFNKLYGWEKVNFSAFAAWFGDLAEKIELISVPKYPQQGELIFRQNIKSAAYFNEYSAAHPRKTTVSRSVPVKTKKGELTPEQKIRLANDEAAGIEFSANKKILKRYATCLEELDEWISDGYRVPDFVTAIGADAFSEIDGLQVKTIIFPEGLTKIGPRAFAGVELENVSFSSSLKTIGKEAFQFTNLKKLVLPDGVVKIEDNAFACCDELKTVSLPDSLTELSSGVFGFCSNLREVRLPANLKIIPSHTFYECPELESIVIPDSVQEIGDQAFAWCPKLHAVELPEGIKIADNAFTEDSPELKITYRKPEKK